MQRRAAAGQSGSIYAKHVEMKHLSTPDMLPHGGPDESNSSNSSSSKQLVSESQRARSNSKGSHAVRGTNRLRKRKKGSEGGSGGGGKSTQDATETQSPPPEQLNRFAAAPRSQHMAVLRHKQDKQVPVGRLLLERAIACTPHVAVVMCHVETAQVTIRAGIMVVTALVAIGLMMLDEELGWSYGDEFLFDLQFVDPGGVTVFDILIPFVSLVMVLQVLELRWFEAGVAKSQLYVRAAIYCMRTSPPLHPPPLPPLTLTYHPTEACRHAHPCSVDEALY